MLTHRAPASKRHRHAGLTLIESLVAIVLLALGVAGLAWTQARLLVDGRQANARATAILLISDLSNRMQFNQATAASGGYTLAWGEWPPAHDCPISCTGAELARADLAAWRAEVRQALPLGDATVFQSGDDARQIGIAIAWPMPDSVAPDQGALADSSPFAVTRASHGVDCPVRQLCQVAYVLP